MLNHLVLKAKACLLAGCLCQSLILVAALGTYFLMGETRYIEPAENSQIALFSPADSLALQTSPLGHVEELKKAFQLDLISFNPDLSFTKLPEPETYRHVVKPGDTLSNIWKKYSNNLNGSENAVKAMKAAGVSLNSIKSGEVLRIKVSGLGGIQSIRKNLDKTNILVLNEDTNGTFSANIRERKVQSVGRTASGFIVSSFARSALDQGIPYEVIDELVDIFGSRIEFRRDLHPGDTFSIIYSEERLPNGKLVKAGPIKAAVITKSGKREIAVRYAGADGKASYYNEKGEPFGNYFLRYPVQFSRISSSFSTSRFHPVLKISRPHNGVDFAAPTGTPVRSVADGVVTYAAYQRGGGNTVKIKHSNRYTTAYLHLNKIEKGIRVGAKVSRGQQIGGVGMTGLATGPHLHFSFYDNNRYVDPMKIQLPSLANPNDRVPASYLKAILAELENATVGLRLAQKEQAEKDNSLG